MKEKGWQMMEAQLFSLVVVLQLYYEWHIQQNLFFLK